MANVLSALKVLIGAETDGLMTGLDKTQQAASTWASRVKSIIGTVSFAGIEVGALAAGQKFEQAAAQISRATGATGEKLDKLNESFANVYKQTAASSEQVAQAMALISTRTGLAGTALEGLTLKMLKLAKTQNEDVAAIAPLVTRVFGDWGIAADSQGKSMDYLRVISQQTGTTVARLTEQIVYAGAPLRQLGYSFDQAAAMIGKWEKEGVNTELVLGGMKAALGKFQKDGIEDVGKAWQDFIAGVRSGAVSASEAVELVGVKRAPDLIAAIKEGRFEIDAMVKSSQTLADQGGKSVTTLKTQFTILQHQIESVVGAHYQLIMALGAMAPIITSIGSVALPVFGGMLASVGNIVTALRFGLVGALSAVETAVAASGVLAVLAALGYGGYKAGDALQQKFAPGVNTTRDSLKNIGVGVPTRPTIGEVFRAAPVPKATPKPTGGSGSSTEAAEIPQYLQASNIDTLAQIGILEQLRAAWGRAKQAVMDFILASEPIGKKLTYDFSDLSDRVLDFSINAASAVVPLHQIEQINWPIAGLEKTDEMMRQLGLSSTRALKEAADRALQLAEALELAREAGQATDSDVTAAAEAAARAHKTLEDRINGVSDAQKKSGNQTSVWGRQVSTVVNDLTRSITDVIFQTKSFGDAFMDVGKAIVRMILEDIVGHAIKSLMNALGGVLSSLGGIAGKLGGIIGGGASSAASAGGAVASGASGAASGAGGILSSGVSSITGLITGAVSAVSGVIGNFQMAGMNKTLDLIENYTRYTKIYTGEQSDSILETLHIVRNTLTDWFGWYKDVELTYLQKMTTALESGKGGGNYNVFNFYSANMDDIKRELKLAGVLP